MVKWSIPAKNDLRQIHDFIAKDSKYYAKKVTTEIIERAERLSLFPSMGRIVPEMNETNIRELIIYSYRLIYEISGEEIEILALLHCKKEFHLTK
ncbi:MAG: type II toxin-antitoxin system RelE/ParE family toxin [Bacteroidota bacterium]|nr:type II toxin-antitoxin system RelE/ParE family toxin [Bacteroidota bacterium]